MILRRIFACSVLALLLSATSLGAACDVSCAFASMSADCHSQQSATELDASGAIKMDGMEMAGMEMPDMDGDLGHQAVSTISETMRHHASIGEMGPCEKHACDSSSAVSAKTNGSSDTHFHIALAVTGTSQADYAQTLFRGARDDIASNRPHRRNSFLQNLRV
ncbi:MAG TPA: hypothetical protein VGI34_09115 [Candidatus Acidoferrales bacterium]